MKKTDSIITLLGKLLHDTVSIIAPPVCRICGGPLSFSEKCICRICIDSLPRASSQASFTDTLARRFAKTVPFVSANTLLHYRRDNSVSQIIKIFKYYNAPQLAQYMGRVMALELDQDIFREADLIIPIPIHFTKRIKRGYNQTELLAEGISETTGIPVATNLFASRPHSTQTHKSREQRAAGADSRFFAVRNPENLRGKRIILLDDVCTTGATLTAAAKTLYSALGYKRSFTPNPPEPTGFPLHNHIPGTTQPDSTNPFISPEGEPVPFLLYILTLSATSD